MYDEEDSMWYDYNHVTGEANKKFYPSNLAPLYTMCHHDDIDFNVTLAKWSRLTAFNYSGGVPTSLERSSQQWDFPNVWPPLVEMMVTALENVSHHTIYCGLQHPKTTKFKCFSMWKYK